MERSISIYTNTDMIHVVLVLSGLSAMVTIAIFAQARYKKGEEVLGMMLVEAMGSRLSSFWWCSGCFENVMHKES